MKIRCLFIVLMALLLSFSITSAQKSLIPDKGWTCEVCGHEGNTGNFCPECGAPKPVDPDWTCPVCGHEGNTGNFCPECGAARPDENVKPTATPKPTKTPKPTATKTPKPTKTSKPTATPTPKPTRTPKPTATKIPTRTPKPTAKPTKTPIPVYTSSAEDAFNDLLQQLYQDGAISSVNGKTTSYGDYEDSWAQIDYYQWITFEHADRFVFSANVEWASASNTPNFFDAGCGVVFNEGDGNVNHLLASIRMDGNVYFTGIRNYNYLSYGTYKYGSASTKGSADFTIVVDRDKATIYLDGRRIVRKADLPIMGNGVGLATLSGTNKDYGTRCTYSDIFFYTW